MKRFDQHRKNIVKLIELNKENLLDSHLKYGGVYLCVIAGAGENGEDSLEVELDGGNLAFTYSVSEKYKDELFDFTNLELRSEGVGCYTYICDWEDALSKD